MYIEGDDLTLLTKIQGIYRSKQVGRNKHRHREGEGGGGGGGERERGGGGRGG